MCTYKGANVSERRWEALRPLTSRLRASTCRSSVYFSGALRGSGAIIIIEMITNIVSIITIMSIMFRRSSSSSSSSSGSAGPRSGRCRRRRSAHSLGPGGITNK